MAVPRPEPVKAIKSLSIAEIFDKYMDWCKKHRSPRAYEWKRNHVQSFLDSLADPLMPVTIFKPFHVVKGVDANATWGDNTTTSGSG